MEHVGDISKCIEVLEHGDVLQQVQYDGAPIYIYNILKIGIDVLQKYIDKVISNYRPIKDTIRCQLQYLRTSLREGQQHSAPKDILG